MSSQGFYNWTSFTEIATGFVLIFGAIATCIGIIFKGSANSRCSQINICWGVLSCERKVKTKEEIQIEEEKPKGYEQEQDEENQDEENNNQRP